MAESIFRVWSIDGHAVVATPPWIDARNPGELRRILLAVTSEHAVTLVDLSETSFLGCEGVGALAGGRQDARAAGRDLQLVVGCPARLRTSTLAGLTALFSVYRTVTNPLGRPRRLRPGGCLGPDLNDRPGQLADRDVRACHHAWRVQAAHAAGRLCTWDRPPMPAPRRRCPTWSRRKPRGGRSLTARRPSCSGRPPARRAHRPPRGL